jgi:hypothetical protein
MAGPIGRMTGPDSIRLVRMVNQIDGQTDWPYGALPFGPKAQPFIQRRAKPWYIGRTAVILPLPRPPPLAAAGAKEIRGTRVPRSGLPIRFTIRTSRMESGRHTAVLWPPIVLTIRTSRMESGRRTAVLWPPIVLTIRTSRMRASHEYHG